MTKSKNTPPESTRGRPGRRSAADRTEAVRLLLSGKSSIEQLSLKYAVSQETIESWRDQGLDALDTAFQSGTARSSKEKELEQQLAQMRAALTRTVMEKELLQQALDIERDKRPTVPRRSRG